MLSIPILFNEGSMLFENLIPILYEVQTGQMGVDLHTLPRELVDHIGSYVSIVSHHNFLSALGYIHWKSESVKVSPRCSIFKTDAWLQMMTEKYGARVIIVGPCLSEIVKNPYFVLYLSFPDFNKPFQSSWLFFRECIQKHTITIDSDVLFNSGLALNVQSLFIQHPTPSALLNMQQCQSLIGDEAVSKLQYSIYGEFLVHDLWPEKILHEDGGKRWTFQIPHEEKNIMMTWRLAENSLQPMYRAIWKVLRSRIGSNG